MSDPRNSGRTGGNPARQTKVFTDPYRLFDEGPAGNAQAKPFLRPAALEALRDIPVGKIREAIATPDGLRVNALIRPDVDEALIRHLSSPGVSVFFGHAPIVVTPRMVWARRMRAVRSYFSHLGLALINRCDREF